MSGIYVLQLAELMVYEYSYLLATATFTPLYGRLCNVMGRRGANQTAVIFAALGTAACGFSTNMETLIAARFVSSHLRLDVGIQ